MTFLLRYTRKVIVSNLANHLNVCHNKFVLYPKLIVVVFCCFLYNCQNNKIGRDKAPVIDSWVTKGDESVLFEMQKSTKFQASKSDSFPTIEIDVETQYQQIEGFGYTLTGGSAGLIKQMGAAQQKNLLDDLFLCKENGKCVSYIRLSMGASDLDEEVFSYNDIDPNSEDLSLEQFSIGRDTNSVIPILKEISNRNPTINIIATPWSPPLWMKTNKSSIGGKLLPKYYKVYALYFVKYILEMQKHGITINAVTVQNEPEHGGNNPSMNMDANEQNEFIKKYLGPAFKEAGLKVKIVLWDHNCDHPEYPISILNDPETNRYVYGSAFHLYAGDISALSKVHDLHPDKKLYLTEQWTGAKGAFSGDLTWHMKNVVIGSMLNWSSVAMQWNLANDPNYKPHTPGGCTECKGAINIDGDNYVKNVSYYIIAHASAHIPVGSFRVKSNAIGDIHHVVFLTPDLRKVMIAINEEKEPKTFNLSENGKYALLSIPGESVVTYVWQ
jgi:glucosylceramidase